MGMGIYQHAECVGMSRSAVLRVHGASDSWEVKAAAARMAAWDAGMGLAACCTPGRRRRVCTFAHMHTHLANEAELVAAVPRERVRVQQLPFPEVPHALLRAVVDEIRRPRHFCQAVLCRLCHLLHEAVGHGLRILAHQRRHLVQQLCPLPQGGLSPRLLRCFSCIKHLVHLCLRTCCVCSRGRRRAEWPHAAAGGGG